MDEPRDILASGVTQDERMDASVCCSEGILSSSASFKTTKVYYIKYLVVSYLTCLFGLLNFLIAPFADRATEIDLQCLCLYFSNICVRQVPVFPILYRVELWNSRVPPAYYENVFVQK